MRRIAFTRDVLTDTIDGWKKPFKKRFRDTHTDTGVFVHLVYRALVLVCVTICATVCPFAAILGRLARVSHQQLMAGATQLVVASGAFA